MSIDIRRVRKLNQVTPREGRVIYWMARDQRITDNWALLYAAEQAAILKQPFSIVFVLLPKFSEATLRQFQFMLEGLQQLERLAQKIGLFFTVELGHPEEVFSRLHDKEAIGLLVTDFSPLKISNLWKRSVAKLPIALHEVDAHNIIPPWIASSKQEYSARTIRSKIHRLLPEWLVDFPKPPSFPFALQEVKTIDWQALYNNLQVDTTIASVKWLQSGFQHAKSQLDRFENNGLNTYDDGRNDPSQDGLSNLSPYLHFGQISAQRVALRIVNSQFSHSASAETFLEELIVRRELAENYCFYNSDYDQPDGYSHWALKTLQDHVMEERKFLYTKEQLEAAQTDDSLWNTAQQELVFSGKMHGYVRMYWAKQLLRWTTSVSDAHALAIYFNDRYELDGRDPNGYTGIAWALGGVHDRPWPVQPIFGNVRSMSFKSTSKKFDLTAYQLRVAQLI